MTHKLDVNWMKNERKLHVDVTVVLTWCHAIYFVTIKLYIFLKATKRICNDMCHLRVKIN